jgi:hypothetical protein
MYEELVSIILSGNEKEFTRFLTDMSSEDFHKRAENETIMAVVFRGCRGSCLADCAKILDMKKRLLCECEKIGFKDQYGHSPLHIAGSLGEKEMVETLLEMEPDAHAENKFGEKAIECALRCIKCSYTSEGIKRAEEIKELLEEYMEPKHKSAAKCC